MENSWAERTELLLGIDAVERLKSCNVLVAGVGGVGSAAVEMLVRAGIGRMTIIDGDYVERSNLNRQLNALTSTLGRPKVMVTAERAVDINPEIRIKTIKQFFSEDDAEALVKSADFDFVIDAIDSMAPKIGLIYNCIVNKIPVISAMGAGGKIDPSQVKLADISKTSQCHLAKAVRRELRLKGIIGGLPVVYSTEHAKTEKSKPLSVEKNKRQPVGTVSYMPAIFGCNMAAYVIQELIK